MSLRLKPLVGIVMGSDSDLPTMVEAAETLADFGVLTEVEILSAHRTPRRMFDYAESAQDRGLKVIIAGAGGSAHLPGMVAALTPLPVIGVPILSKALSGVDSLLSIVQMPPGVPVATVAVGGAKNAGLLAAQILMLSDPDLAERVREYKARLGREVAAKNQSLKKLGPRRYLRRKQ
ncbi:5-(carboxyamino)imidazole ribonucleotide mutase [Deltaproteobacteria bacterium PRO3]|nr:5-(carboxyamino)imidazole ribonucleotide mutase [Deltaproteobacteria bacterium PRO3]